MLRRFLTAVTLIGLILTVTTFPVCGRNYSGHGDDLIAIEKPISDLPALAIIRGNTTKRHFAVKSYDHEMDYITLLVNTTDAYMGVIPIDLPNTTVTGYLEIKAQGPWEISIISIGDATRIKLGEQKTGIGDHVLWVEDDGVNTAKSARIDGNPLSNHFAVKAFDSYGLYNGLLVNTTSRYSGRVRMPKDTLVIVIKAVGEWTITLEK